MVTPGSGQAAGLLHHEHATPDVGTHAGRGPNASAFAGHSLASLVAAPQPMAPGADIAGTLASAFALLPGGGELAGELRGPAGEEGDRLSPFSAAPFLPLSSAALARAASTPGPQGGSKCRIIKFVLHGHLVVLHGMPCRCFAILRFDQRSPCHPFRFLPQGSCSSIDRL